LSGLDVNGYMANNFVPGTSKTYLSTFTDESVRSYAGIDKKEDTNKYFSSSSGDSQLAILFMQIKTEGDPKEIAEEAAFLTGTAIGGGGLLTGVGRKIFATFPIASTVVALAGTGGAYLFAEKSVKDNQAISFASCNQYEKDETKAKLGCSLVKPITWDAKEVNRICTGGIEGNL